MTLVNEKESCVCSPCHGGGRRRALIPYATGGGCACGMTRGRDRTHAGPRAAKLRKRSERLTSTRSKTAGRPSRSLACRVVPVVYASSKQLLTSNAGKSRALASVRAGLLPTPLSH